VAIPAQVAAEQPRGPANPRAVVVRIGAYSVTGATLNRFLGAELGSQPESEHLVPPDFSACVAHLEAEAAARGERSPSLAQLRSECQARYRTVLQTVLRRLIADEWLIGGSRQLGVATSESEVKAYLDRYRHDGFSSKAQFQHFLAGRTVADVMFEMKAKLASEAIRRAIKDRVRPIARKQITSYYNSHKFHYLVTGSRDVEIARTATESSAAKVKAEVASGKSFASVVRKLPLHQPEGSSEGLVLELGPHAYGEPNLNEAIFTARPGVLTGPIGTWYGYLVFEVTKIRIERLKPLAQVEASIRQKLARPPQAEALAAFTRRWRTTWTARTDCSSGDVVPGCRQFKGSPGATEGLPALN
jgi:PPIC-type PPIASE domain